MELVTNSKFGDSLIGDMSECCAKRGNTASPTQQDEDLEDIMLRIAEKASDRTAENALSKIEAAVLSKVEECSTSFESSHEAPLEGRLMQRISSLIPFRASGASSAAPSVVGSTAAPSYRGKGTGKSAFRRSKVEIKGIVED